MKFTSGPYTNGWGWGLTGPNTPRSGGVTCEDACEDYAYMKKLNERKESDPFPEYPKIKYIPISVGQDTLAIVVGPNREANAKLFAAAPRLFRALQGILEIGKRDMTNPKYDGFFRDAKEAIEEVKGDL